MDQNWGYVGVPGDAADGSEGAVVSDSLSREIADPQARPLRQTRAVIGSRRAVLLSPWFWPYSAESPPFSHWARITMTPPSVNSREGGRVGLPVHKLRDHHLCVSTQETGYDLSYGTAQRGLRDLPDIRTDVPWIRHDAGTSDARGGAMHIARARVIGSGGLDPGR